MKSPLLVLPFAVWLVAAAAGLEADLGFTPRVGDKFYFFDPTLQAYRSSTRRPSGIWSGTGGQVVDLAQGFFYQVTAAGLWTRSFQVSPPPSSQVSNIVIGRSGGNVRLDWTLGVVQAADGVMGPWADVPGASSPWTTSATGKARFFRLRSP